MMLSMAPSLPGFEIQEIDKFDDEYVVVATTTACFGKCPTCQEESKAVHSWYERTPMDLPSCGMMVRLCLQVRRFFCLNQACRQHIFCERLPELLGSYARRTQRMNQQLQHLALVLGGQLGAVTTEHLAMSVSASTLLRLTRAKEIELPAPVRVLGIDDWAKRKRHEYGTILVDLERHQVIDLLPDRTSETLADWLQAHPEVELVTRDRWKSYADAIKTALPEAVQIADRFHLIQNLVDTLKRLFDRKGNLIQQATQALALEKQAVSAETKPEVLDTTPTHTTSPKSWRELRFEEVKKLQAQGVSKRAIARQLGMHRKTVTKYFELETYPPRPITPQTTFRATPHLSHMMERWEAGVHSYKVLHEGVS